MEIKKYYEEIRKNKDLPSFDEINLEFGIDCIEKGNFALQIAERIIEKTEKYRKFLEEFLHADGSSIAVLMEINGMDKKEKDSISSLYQELTIIEREFLLAELESREEVILRFIDKNIGKWNLIKPKLKVLISKAKNSWQDESKTDTKLGYLG